MKVSITLKDLTVAEATEMLNRFSVGYIVGVDQEPPAEDAVDKIVTEVSGLPAYPDVAAAADETVAAEPKRKKRRTKAEMEAARAAEEEKTDPVAPPAGAEATESTGRRRRRRDRNDAAEGESDAPRGRRRRGAVGENPTGASPSQEKSSAKDADGAGAKKSRRASKKSEASASSPSDEELTDADVAMAASDAARVLTPKVVTETLEEFGVAYIGDLDQPQRREFIALLKDKIDSVGRPTRLIDQSTALSGAAAPIAGCPAPARLR